MRPARLVWAARWAEEPSRKPRQGPEEGRVGREERGHGRNFHLRTDHRPSRVRGPLTDTPPHPPLSSSIPRRCRGSFTACPPLLSLLPGPPHPQRGSFFSCTSQTSPALLTTSGRQRLQQRSICFSLRNATPRQGHPVQLSARPPCSLLGSRGPLLAHRRDPGAQSLTRKPSLCLDCSTSHLHLGPSLFFSEAIW